jgi:hypothetical protein
MSETADLSNAFSFTVDGWYLFACKGRARESDQFTHTSFILGSEEEEIAVYDTVLGQRSWRTEPIWWFIDAILSRRVDGGFTYFGGFRYDKFSTRFKNVTTDGIPPSTPNDTADITFKSYIPYIGFQQEYKTGATSLLVRFLGFPYVPSHVTHLQTGETGVGLRTEARGNLNNGYFFEAVGEYSYQRSANTSWGLFARWNQLHAKGEANIEVPGLTGYSSFVVHRPSLTVGGMISFSF